MAIDSSLDKALSLMDAAWSSRSVGNYERATEDIKKAIAILREVAAHADLATALGRLGHIEMDREHWENAQAAYEEAILVCQQIEDTSGLAHKQRHLGDVHRHAGRLDEALQCYRTAITLYGSLSDPAPLDFANALRAAAIAEEDVRRNGEAARLWSKARDLYRSLDLDDGVIESTERLNALMQVPLSQATESILVALFEETETAIATRLLVDKCGRNLPLMDNKDAAAIERIRIAALKVSGGDTEALERAIELANIDWRDLLVEAGFAHDVTAHLDWRPD